MAGAAAVALLLTGCGGEEESTGNYPPAIDLPPGYGGMDDETPTDGESPTDQESASDGTDGGAEREFTEWELERHAMPPPERPAGITDPSDDGAIATAIYFVELIAYSQETNRTSEIAEISHPDCSYCQSFIDNAEEALVAGSYVENSGLTIHGSDIYQPDDFDGLVVGVHGEEPEYVQLDAHGEYQSRESGVAFTQAVVLLWSGTSWDVFESAVELIDEDGQ